MNTKTAIQLTLGLVGALALATAGAVNGEGGKSKLSEEQKELMSQLDINGDGVISEAEAQTAPELAERFRQLDENRDGVLETAEFARFEVSEERPDS